MSTSAEHIATMAVPPERRFYRRTVPSGWISIAFGENNVGMLLNVSENGLLVSTPVELGRNFAYRVSLKLTGLPRPIEVPVRVVWTTESKRAGIQILDISEHQREQIRKWEALEEARDAIATKSPTPEPVNEVAPAPEPQQPKPTLTASEQRLAAPPLPLVSPEAPAPPEHVAEAEALEPRAATHGQPVAKSVALIATVCLALALFSKNGPLHSLIGHLDAVEEQRSAANSPSPKPSAEHQRAARPQDRFVEPDSAPHTNAISSNLLADKGTNRGDDLESAPLDRSKQRKLATEDRNEVFPLRAPTFIYKPVSPTEPIARTSAVSPPPAPDLAPTPINPSSALVVVPKAPAPIAPPHVLRPSRPAATSDLSQNQTLQVTIPNIHTSIVSLPGEQVVQSASATLHIHRSILVPVESRFWPLSRSRKVVLGGLLFRSDPQAPRGSVSSTANVGVRATIDKNGHVENLQPISGSMALVPGVVRAVREWRYQPTFLDGKPVATEAFILVEFRAPASLGRGSK